MKRRRESPDEAEPPARSRISSAARRVKAALRQPIVVDLRNIYRREDMAALGFHYESLGRGRRGGDRLRKS